MIFLCSLCHDTVHDDEYYTPEILIKLKKEQERRTEESENELSKFKEEQHKFMTEFEHLSILPMFPVFQDRNEYWLSIRENLAFSELNPIHYEGEFESSFPMSGTSFPVAKSTYGMMPNEHYSHKNLQTNIPYSESIWSNETNQYENELETSIVLDVFQTEFSKAIFDLLTYCKENPDVSKESETLSSFENTLRTYENPILLMDNLIAKYIDRDWKDKEKVEEILYGRDNNFPLEIYLDQKKTTRRIVTLGEKEIPVILYEIPRKIRNQYDLFDDVRGIIIDKNCTVYRQKQPLQTEWSVLKKPVKINTPEGEIFDSDFLNFKALTLSEIKYEGNIFVWRFKKEEYQRIISGNMGSRKYVC